MNCANHFDREQTAFCQNCGKPLCQECTRKIGEAVYCEPCLASKLAGVGAVPPPIPAPGAYRYNDPTSGINVSGTQAGGTYTYTEPTSGIYASGVIPPQPPHGAPNPLLAGFLGFIPGVGAMYNEQYAKAGVHLVVFVILVSIANHSDAFGFFVAGWEFYMAFEAFQTARARRDGLPLPNPFGLNELGQKLGFDKTSGHPSGSATASPPDPYAASYGATPPAAAAPVYPPVYGQPYPPSNPAGGPPLSWGVPPAQGWEQYNPAIPPMPPGTVPLDAKVPYPGNRFPAGAIWLIGLGAIFLIFNAGFMSGISGRIFLPILLWGVAIFIFIRRMTDYGYGFTNDGTPGYSVRIFRALRGSVWVALTGLLFFLDEFTPLKWSHSWPLYIILAGVMTVLQRVVYSGAAGAYSGAAGAYSGAAGAPPYVPGYGYPAPAPPPAAAPFAPAPAAPAPIVPSSTHDQEGS